MDDYITKPVKPEELQRALERCTGATVKVEHEPAAAVTPTIDRSILESLRELQDPDEPDFVTELIDVLVADVPAKLQVLEAALAEGDARTVNRTAHSLKSSCGNLGAMRLSQLFAAIERNGAEGALDSVSALLEQARAEFDQVNSALAAERRDPSSEAA